MKMKKTDILDKSFKFSLEVIKLYNQLRAEKEFIISKQLLRSATSIVYITTAIVKTAQKNVI